MWVLRILIDLIPIWITIKISEKNEMWTYITTETCKKHVSLELKKIELEDIVKFMTYIDKNLGNKIT